jgi:hypothetical protein
VAASSRTDRSRPERCDHLIEAAAERLRSTVLIGRPLLSLIPQTIPPGATYAVNDPREAARVVNAFLGGRLDEAAMSAAIDAELYRNRKA